MFKVLQGNTHRKLYTRVWLTSFHYLCNNMRLPSFLYRISLVYSIDWRTASRLLLSCSPEIRLLNLPSANVIRQLYIRSSSFATSRIGVLLKHRPPFFHMATGRSSRRLLYSPEMVLISTCSCLLYTSLLSCFSHRAQRLSDDSYRPLREPWM